MKQYIKRYIKIAVKKILRAKLPPIFYAIFHKIRYFATHNQQKDNQLLNSYNVKTNIDSNLIISLVKSNGTGVETVINVLKNEKQNVQYITISKTEKMFSAHISHNNELTKLEESKNAFYLIDKIVKEYQIKTIDIHHLRWYFNKTIILYLQNLFIPINVHLHDFFFICPSMFLMDDKNKFCNLDKQKDCHKCSIIQAATSPFSNIEMNSVSQFRNINSWRETSQKLFDISSKIIAYSQTTIDMYKKIFKIPEEKIEISNALLSSSIHFKKLPKDYNLQKFDKINIAMIGSWHYVKGSEVFKEMEKIINTNKNLYQDVNLYFIGKGFCDIRSKIKNLGIYNSQNLATIIEENKISICFVPSICCETFSITTQDCIAVGIPIATFGIGAMKERLLGLKNALIINAVTNENIRNFTNKEIANISINNILNFMKNKNNIAN